MKGTKWQEIQEVLHFWEKFETDSLQRNKDFSCPLHVTKFCRYPECIWKQIFSQSLHRISQTRQNLGCNSDLQNFEIIHLCCFQLLNLWQFERAAIQKISIACNSYVMLTPKASCLSQIFSPLLSVSIVIMLSVSIGANFMITYTQVRVWETDDRNEPIFYHILHQALFHVNMNFLSLKRWESASLHIDSGISHMFYLAIAMRQKWWCGEPVLSLTLKRMLNFPLISLVSLISPK